MANQIPRVAEIVGPGIDALVSERPKALQWIDSDDGAYRDVIEGIGAQASMVVRRLAAEVAAARVDLAEKDELTQTARSEFDTDRVSVATTAIGTVTIARPAPAVGSAPGGGIPKGRRFRRDANPSAIPPVPASVYTTTRDVAVPLGALSIDLPVVASKAGSAGNAPLVQTGGGAGFVNAASGIGSLVIADTLFDATFAVASYQAAGGSDGESDADLRTQAKAYARGQYGPTIDAILAGALRGTGVHRAKTYEITSWGGQPAAVTGVCIADASWASSAAWIASVQQTIADTFQGFGGTIIVTGPQNALVRVDARVTLRDASYLINTEDISAAIQSAVRAYFDDRPDWYTFRLAGLRAAISGADRRILACYNVGVRAVSDNVTVPEPSATPTIVQNVGLSLTHYMLAANGVTITYRAPT